MSIYENAKKLRNKVVDLCNNAKNEYTYNNIEDNRHNPKKFWNNIQKLWGDASNLSSKNNQILLSDPVTGKNCKSTDSADVFNEFFCNIASKIQSNIQALTATESNAIKSAQATNSKKLNHKIPFRQVCI